MDEALSPPSKRRAVPVNAGQPSWKVQAEQGEPMGWPSCQAGHPGDGSRQCPASGEQKLLSVRLPSFEAHFFCVLLSIDLGTSLTTQQSFVRGSRSLKGFQRVLLCPAQKRVSTPELGGTGGISFQASMANHIKGDLVGSAFHCCHMFCPVLEWCYSLECIHASPNLITRLNPLSCFTPLEFSGFFQAPWALSGAPSQANADAWRYFNLFIYFPSVFKIILTTNPVTSPTGEREQWML